MTTTFPAKPWTEGDTFTNDATGVSYTYSGGKLLASGGPDGGVKFTPGQKVAADAADDAVKGGFYIEGGNLYIKMA